METESCPPLSELTPEGGREGGREGERKVTTARRTSPSAGREKTFIRGRGAGLRWLGMGKRDGLPTGKEPWVVGTLANHLSTRLICRTDFIVVHALGSWKEYHTRGEPRVRGVRRCKNHLSFHHSYHLTSINGANNSVELFGTVNGPTIRQR